MAMVLFYDPKDENELSRVEEILRRGGIEYFLQDESETHIGPQQVLVAEEDVPAAEALILQAGGTSH